MTNRLRTWLSELARPERLEEMDALLVRGVTTMLVGVLGFVVTTSVVIGADSLTQRTSLFLLVWDVGCLVLARAGYSRAAALSLCVGIMAVMLITSPYYGGLQGTTIQALPVMPLFAALLVGPIAGAAMGGLAVVLVAMQWYAETQLGLEPLRYPTPEDQLLTTVGLSITIAAVSGLKVHQLRRSTLAARQAATSARDAEQHLRDALTTAEGASTAKSQFLANMSHELRTPLNAIIGYAEFLLEDADDETAPDLVRIRTAGGHLLQLVNDVLDLGRIEAGKMTVAFEPTRLEPLIHDVTATVQPAVDKHDSQLHIELDPALGRVITDPIRLRQILLNLLSNAAKFTESGRITLTARRRPDSPSDIVSISVTDTGIGIAAEQMTTLFEPFVQGDPSTERRYGGTGLGLALSAHFARILGGELHARSRLGEGSRFTLVLPVSPPVELVTRDSDTAPRFTKPH